MIMYINKRNLLIRFVMALIVVASVWLALQGGIDYVNAKSTSYDLPEGYSATDPLSDKALQTHVSNTALNENYSIRFDSTVTVPSQTIESRSFTLDVNNIDRLGFKQISETGSQVERRTIEEYETEDTIYTNKNGDITTDSKQNDYDSPILENQFVTANYGLTTFRAFTWTVEETTEDEIVYTIARADAVGIPYLTTIDTVDGELVINRDKGYIKNINVDVWGSGRQYPLETIYVSYSYDVSTGETEVQKPNWVSEEIDAN